MSIAGRLVVIERLRNKTDIGENEPSTYFQIERGLGFDPVRPPGGRTRALPIGYGPSASGTLSGKMTSTPVDVAPLSALPPLEHVRPGNVVLPTPVSRLQITNDVEELAGRPRQGELGDRVVWQALPALMRDLSAWTISSTSLSPQPSPDSRCFSSA
jgi:hypothetical protein